jgi:hypothetical protein
MMLRYIGVVMLLTAPELQAVHLGGIKPNADATAKKKVHLPNSRQLIDVRKTIAKAAKDPSAKEYSSQALNEIATYREAQVRAWEAMAQKKNEALPQDHKKMLWQ